VPKAIDLISTLPLSSKHRVSQVSFHPTQPYLAVQCHDRSVEIFRVRTDDEIRKKQARRRKRAKEKQKAGGNEDVPMDDVEEAIAITDRFTPYLIVRASGKVRSFNFTEIESSTKANTQVRLYSLLCLQVTTRAFRFFLPLRTTLLKSTTFLRPRNPKMLLSRHASTR
jgi:U3 small nucleolar RNA-associated protein 12